MKTYKVSYPCDTHRQWQYEAKSPREAAEQMAKGKGAGEFIGSRWHGPNYIAYFAAGTGAGMNRQTFVTVWDA